MKGKEIIEFKCTFAKSPSHFYFMNNENSLANSAVDILCILPGISNAFINENVTQAWIPSVGFPLFIVCKEEEKNVSRV